MKDHIKWQRDTIREEYLEDASQEKTPPEASTRRGSKLIAKEALRTYNKPFEKGINNVS